MTMKHDNNAVIKESNEA